MTTPKFLSSKVEKCAFSVSIFPSCLPSLSPSPSPSSSPPLSSPYALRQSLSLPFLPLPQLTPPSSALSGQNGHPDGHLGRAWEIAVGVSLGASPVYLCTHSLSFPSLGLLLFGAVVIITIVTIRQRRRGLHRSDCTYPSHPPPALLPSMPYGISRVRRPSNLTQSR